MPFFQKRVRSAVEGFGEALRELRELRSLSREDLSASTGIHASIIRALEDERLSDLTDPVYAERHVRAIVKTLGARDRYYVDKYRALLLARGIGTEKIPMLTHRVQWKEMFASVPMLRIVGIIIVVLFLVSISVWQIRHLQQAPTITVFTPIDGEIVDSPHVRVTGRVDSGSSVQVNGESAVVDDSGNFLAVIDVPRGLATVHIDAKKRYGASRTLDRHVIFSDTTSPTSSAR